jgi:hypothetical protein
MESNKTCIYGHAMRYFVGEEPVDEMGPTERILEFADIMGLSPRVAGFLYYSHRPDRTDAGVKTRKDAANILRQLATMLEGQHH